MPATPEPPAPGLAALIPVGSTPIGGATIPTVNSRHIHTYLQVGKDHSTWIKDRIAKFRFVEGVDFVTTLLPNFGEKGQGRDLREYFLTLDMGKELGMVDRSERGREIRRYFLGCERKLAERSAAPTIMPDLTDPVVLTRLLIEQAQGRIEDQRRAAVAEAAAVVAQSQLGMLSSAQGSMCPRDAAKTLGFAKCDRIFAELHTMRWIYKRDGKGSWVAHQDKIRAGLLEHEDYPYKDSAGEDRIRSQVMVTARGLVKLAELFSPSLFN